MSRSLFMFLWKQHPQNLFIFLLRGNNSFHILSAISSLQETLSYATPLRGGGAWGRKQLLSSWLVVGGAEETTGGSYHRSFVGGFRFVACLCFQNESLESSLCSLTSAELHIMHRSVAMETVQLPVPWLNNADSHLSTKDEGNQSFRYILSWISELDRRLLVAWEYSCCQCCCHLQSVFHNLPKISFHLFIQCTSMKETATQMFWKIPMYITPPTQLNRDWKSFILMEAEWRTVINRCPPVVAGLLTIRSQIHCFFPNSAVKPDHLYNRK